MSKPLNEFGGWLRAFQIFTIIGICIQLGLMAGRVFYVGGQGAAAPWTLSTFVGMGWRLAVIVVALLILLKIRRAMPEVPTQVAKLIIASAAIRIVGSLVAAAIEQLPVRGLSSTLSNSVIIPGIWVGYFISSKRVLTFYGANAFKK